jgi:predicted enzyme related to lactoylglutathione lyase
VSVERDVGLARRAREPMRLMPNFVVDDAIVAERRLIGMGVTWIRELEATTWGRIATLLDPDGNYVQLFELPGRESEVTQ